MLQDQQSELPLKTYDQSRSSQAMDVWKIINSRQDYGKHHLYDKQKLTRNEVKKESVKTFMKRKRNKKG